MDVRNLTTCTIRPDEVACKFVRVNGRGVQYGYDVRVIGTHDTLRTIVVGYARTYDSAVKKWLDDYDEAACCK